MKRFIRSGAAFSLVEVTLALGVAGFCLIALFGLLPIGVQTNQRSTSQTAATAILSFVMADMRATPTTTTTCALNSQCTITFGSPATFYVNEAGQFTPSPGADSRYRLSITFSTAALAYPATYANLRVTWPASVDPATTTPAGSMEMFAAFDRH
jgi:uncharacterized protein (TIGR02598 family)